MNHPASGSAESIIGHSQVESNKVLTMFSAFKRWFSSERLRQSPKKWNNLRVRDGKSIPRFSEGYKHAVVAVFYHPKSHSR